MSVNLRSEASVWGGRIGDVRAFLDHIDELGRYGAPMPKKLGRIRAAWDAVNLDPGSARERLAEAIAEGRADDVPDLLITVVVAQSGNVTEIKNVIANRVKTALVSTWEREGAKPAYAKLASDFDTAAAKLTACAELVDIQAPADALVRNRVPKQAMEAWLAAREHEAELDRLLPVLARAAEMLPMPIGKRTTSGDDSKPGDWLLALCCDPGDAHRRRVWEAWQAKGAGGRWGKLLALGARLRAHPEPSDFEVYERPIPTVVHQEVSRAGSISGVKQWREDPEDALHARRLAAAGEIDAHE
jgi:hypothetical protein